MLGVAGCGRKWRFACGSQRCRSVAGRRPMSCSSRCYELAQLVVGGEIACGLAFGCADLTIGAASHQFACEIKVIVLGGAVQGDEAESALTVDLGACIE